MLTVETIKTNCPDITDEMAGKIAELSKNDEDGVIGARFGEVYRQLDTTIEKATGIKRDGDEKTYNYLERAAKAIKATADQSAKDVARLTEENSKLQKAIADGATDTATKEKLMQTEKDLASVREAYNKLKTDFDTEKANFNKTLFDVKIENSVSTAFQGVKFKESLSAPVVEMAKKSVLEKIKLSNPEITDDGNGGKTIIFKDSNGAVLRNPDNALNPFTVGELVSKELTALGVLAQKRTQTGSGGNGGNGGNGGAGSIVDVSGAKTQTEAYEIIAQSLFAKGLANGSRAFDEEMQKIWKDNNIAKLPTK